MPASSRNSVSFCLFVVFEEKISHVDEARLQAIPGLQKVYLYTPDRAHDPFLNDGAPPPLALQFYFRTLAELEAARYDALGLGGAASCQAMQVRTYVAEPVREPYCTYLVGYEGPAEDPAAWLAYYLAHHPPLMGKLPGIRELEIYTPVEWGGAAPWRKVNWLQRNKVAFDDAAALTAALESPVRREMRADYARLPRFSGAVKHYAMATRRLLS
jgi:uncharacterized protein (TIGR02118 family)